MTYGNIQCDRGSPTTDTRPGNVTAMGSDDDRDLLPPLGSSQFDVVRRGYDRAQVDDVVEALEADLQIVIADRDATTTQAASLARQLDAVRREMEEMRSQLQRLSKPPTSLEGMSERLQRMLRLAQDEAAEIQARAESTAEQTIKRADEQSADIRGRYERLIAETEGRRVAVEAEHERTLADARREAEQIVQAARERSAALDAEAEKRQTQVEEDFEIVMSERRSTTMRTLAEQESASAADARRRVAEATEEAHRRVTESKEHARRLQTETEQRCTAMVDEARSRVDQLRRLRHQVAVQLLAARSMLNDASRGLTSEDGDQPAHSAPEQRTPASTPSAAPRTEVTSGLRSP